MAVNDHGLEVLKKSGEEVTAGDKSDYYIKTSINDSSGDPIDLVVTNDGHLEVVAVPSAFWEDTLCVMTELLKEIKIANAHLAEITNDEKTFKDIN